MTTRIWIPLAVLAGCKIGNQAMTPPSTAEVQIQLAGERADRPPIVTVFLDVTLHNPDAAPRWYLVPAQLGAGEELRTGSINSVTVHAGQGVRIGRFAGLSAFHAVRLGAGATLQITQLPVELWYEDTPAALSFDVTSSPQLAIGPDAADAWLGLSASEPAAPRVDYAALAVVTSRSTPDLDERPVVLTATRNTPIRLDRKPRRD